MATSKAELGLHVGVEFDNFDLHAVFDALVIFQGRQATSVRILFVICPWAFVEG